jgi:hypothetical protein
MPGARKSVEALILPDGNSHLITDSWMVQSLLARCGSRFRQPVIRKYEMKQGAPNFR